MKNLAKDHVLGYMNNLHGDLSQYGGAWLDVQRVSVPEDSVLETCGIALALRFTRIMQ